MLYSYNWIKKFLNKIPPVGDISNRLTMSGFEVESVERLFGDLKGIVTAVVNGVKPHPSDKNLSVVNVSAGEHEFITVTGAKGITQGMIVAYAQPGSVVANKKTILELNIKGVKSAGMIISEDELGIFEAKREIIIFDKAVKPGLDVKSVLELDDWVLDVAVMPNRSDVLSHFGIAREIATIFHLNVIQPSFELDTISYNKENKPIDVEVENPDDCPRYAIRFLSDVKIAQSPLWLRLILGKIKQKPINNVVDITNYVMFAIGQPLHAFDGEKVHGGKIIVRRAKNEKLITLDGVERILTDQSLVIADDSKPVAIAGIMGGAISGITENTRYVLLESALFDSGLVRTTGRNLGLSTEAGYRFERGVDSNLPRLASDMASYLVSGLAGAKVYRLVDSYKKRYKKRRVTTTIQVLGRLIGIQLNIKTVQSVLRSIHCDVNRIRANTLSIEPPSFRLDLKESADFSEEIARLIGYEKIPSVLPLKAAANVAPPLPYKYINIIKERLLSMGFDEVINYSFYSDTDHSIVGGDALRLTNPLNEQTTNMRKNLIPLLIKNTQFNLFRQIEDQKLFEIGNVYFKQAGKYVEELHLAGTITGNRYPLHWAFKSEHTDIFDSIGIVEDIMNVLGFNDKITKEKTSHNFLNDDSVLFSYNNMNIGYAGGLTNDLLDKYDIKQKVFVFDVSLDHILMNVKPETRYREVPKYPHIVRDLSIVKPVSLTSAKIINGIKSLGIDLLIDISPFDLYIDNKDISKHSITYRFIFRAEDRTLKDEEVDLYMKTIMNHVVNQYGVKLKIQGGIL
ncbi:MAG: phenylalanine--tRNA ligase subunit beta [Deltaproteobacteria bacterium]|nr:phenylalanine--tRNA ligase subunit beta [Deltaproteobacteria bacterium]MCL5792272.1 phenylalanine--tRNA ligase subunit beta [Deltaproteobacteria bacterium]